MEISQKLLALSALYAVLVGAGLGLVFDLFRILRIAGGDIPREGSVRFWLHLTVIFVEDIGYALICAVVVIVFIFHVNQGRVRGFMLIAAGSGFWLYYATVGRLVMRMAERLIAGVRWLMRQTVRPLLWMCAVIGRRKAEWDSRRQSRQLIRLAGKGFP